MFKQPFSRGGVGLIGYLLCHLVRTIRHTYYYLRSASLKSSWFLSRTAVCIVHSKIKIRFGVFLITKLLTPRRTTRGMPLHNIIYTYQYYNRNTVGGYFYFIRNNNGLEPSHMYTVYIPDNSCFILLTHQRKWLFLREEESDFHLFVSFIPRSSGSFID